MTNFLEVTSLSCLLPSPYYYDVGNVAMIHRSFIASLRGIPSYKACADLHTIYRRTNEENGFSAFFEVMLTCCSVTHLFITNVWKQ
jgi:hypothetical protein